MRVLVLAALVVFGGDLSCMGQEEAFVRQLSTQSAAQVQQNRSNGGAFVSQLPLSAKPRVATAAPRKPRYVPQSFIRQPARDTDENEPVVVNEDAGIVGYGEAPRPALPAIRSGVSVVLTLPGTATHLPDIGAGAVML